MTAATGAWAASFSTTPYSSDATLSGVTVSSDMTIIINSGVTVTVNNGLDISSGTLTVGGGGTLVVNGAGSGGIAVKGNIIVQGATVRAYGGTGSTGSTGSTPGNSGLNAPSNGGTGGTGGNGGAAFSGAVVIYSGQIVAQGGTGGTGGRGGNGGNTNNPVYNGGNGGTGGRGGNGGTAFTSTLTVYGGNVDAIGGNAGSGGSGGSGGYRNGSYGQGSSGSGGSSGSNGSAFSNANNLTLINTTDSRMYSDANKTNQIYSVSGKNIYITAPNAVPSLTLSEATDNATWISDHAGLVYDITLTRTLQTGGWNTFSVPFSIAKPSGWTVKELTDASFEDATNTLSLTFGDAESIVAGHAYLVQVESAVVNPTFNDVTIVNDPTPTTISGVVEFVPAINPTALTLNDKSCLFVSGGNTLTWASSGSSMNGFRAYFHILNSSIANARTFSMSFGNDDVMGIIGVSADELVTDGAVYTLDGRKLNGQPTQKGVYVVNGKKVIIK